MSCESKQGVRVIWTLPRQGEIYAMLSNDRDTAAPSVTWNAINAMLEAEAQEHFQRRREFAAMKSHDKKNREIEGMESNDYRIRLESIGGPIYVKRQVPFTQCPNYGNPIYEDRVRNKRRRIDKHACGRWNCWKHAHLDYPTA